MFIDRQQFEPPDEEEIEAYAAFSTAVMENIELNCSLFDAITNWSKERMIAYQQAFVMINAAIDPDSFGIED